MIYIDFETRSELDLKKVGAWLYSKHSSTEILCMAFRYENISVELWEPDLFDNTKNDLPFSIGIFQGQKEKLIEAHNAYFERCIWENICIPRYDWPRVLPSQWRCSAAKAASCSLPRSLEGVGSALNLQSQKDKIGRRIMLKLSKPRKPTKHNKAKWHADQKDFDLLFDYCKKDVLAEKAVSDSLPELSPLELKVWQLDQKINMRGIYCDIEAVKGALKILEIQKQNSEKELQRITQGAIQTAGQIAQIKNYCELYGVQLKDLSKETVELTLEKDLPSNARKVLEIRQSQSKSSTKKYQAMLNRTDNDSRIRETILYHGATTGRWAGRGVQTQNYPKGKIKDQSDIDFAIELIKRKDVAAIEMCFGDVAETLKSCLRGMLCAAPGKTLIASDYKAIEARVLLWLANDQIGLNLFKNDIDIYVDMAATIYNTPISEITKDQREMGKRSILGLGYQMGIDRFIGVCWEWGGIKIGYKEAEKAVNEYRYKYMSVVKLWRALEEAAIYTVRTGRSTKCGKLIFEKSDRFLYCKLPSGRRIHYFDPKIENQNGYAKLTYMGTNSQTHKWDRIHTYGGKLVENATQAVARDLLAEAMLHIENIGYPIVLSVHDEVVCEVDKALGSIKTLNQLMCKLPPWAIGLPVKAVGWKGKRFRK